SYDGRINYSDFINTTTNYSQISKESTNAVIINNTTDVANNGNNFNLNQGVSMKYKIDTTGSEWSTDVSYNYSPNVSNQTFVNTFYVPAIPANGGDGKIKTQLNFFSAESNLTYKLPKKFTIETGVKTSLVGFNNTTNYFRGSGAARIKDEGRTSSYHYNENINAAYFQASKNIHGVIIKAGTRLENINMQGNQFIPSDTY